MDVHRKLEMISSSSSFGTRRLRPFVIKEKRTALGLQRQMPADGWIKN